MPTRHATTARPRGAWTHAQARRYAVVGRALAIVLLAGVAGAAVFGVPVPSAGVAPLPERFEPTALPTRPPAPEPRRVDIADLAFPFGLTHNAPVPPASEPEGTDVASVDPEPEPTPAPRDGVRYLGSAVGTGGLAWAIVVIEGKQSLLQVGRTVSGVELVSIEDDGIVIRSGGRERRVERAERSKPASVSVANAAPAPAAPVIQPPAGGRGATPRTGAVSAMENMSAAERAQLIREQRERARVEQLQRGQD